METIWFVLWSVLWAVYLMLDGFDLGLGTMLPFVAKTDTERRVVFNAMGPFWDGNEVWLLTAGGATFAAFPTTYAVMFSALYTPLMLLLFALILRGISFEMRSQEESPLWRKGWDMAMTVGSFLPALLLGVFFANLFAGVPIDKEGVFQGNLFTLLHPYGLLGGLLFVLMFLVHGAIWLVIKAEGALAARGEAVATKTWPVLLVVAVAFLVHSKFATRLWDNYMSMPALLVLPLLAVAGLVLSRLYMARGQWWRAWFASSAFIVGAAGFGVGGMFPNLLISSLDPAFSLTAYNSASSTLTLSIMLGVVLVAIPAVIAYQIWVYSRFRDKVDLADLKY